HEMPRHQAPELAILEAGTVITSPGSALLAPEREGNAQGGDRQHHGPALPPSARREFRAVREVCVHSEWQPVCAIFGRFSGPAKGAEGTQMIKASLERPQRGFTLLEIMVVVVIIGLLAAAVVPLYMGQVDRAQTNRAKQDLRSIDSALQLYRLDNFR